MKDDSKIISIDPNLDENNSNDWIEKVLKHKNKILIGFCALITLGLVTGYFLQHLSVKKSKKTALAYSSLDDTSAIQSHANLKQVRKIADRYRFLQSHLDAPLAQEYLNKGHLKNAKALSARINQRLDYLLPVVQKFNQITLQIAEGNYESALSQSYQLTEKLEENKMETLKDYHHLRIAALEKKLGKKESYQQTVKQLAAEKTDLKLGHLSLKDFLLAQ